MSSETEEGSLVAHKEGDCKCSKCIDKIIKHEDTGETVDRILINITHTDDCNCTLCLSPNSDVFSDDIKPTVEQNIRGIQTTQEVNLNSDQIIENQPSKVKVFQCDVCEKILPSCNALKRHKLIHTGERNYE